MYIDTNSFPRQMGLRDDTNPVPIPWGIPGQSDPRIMKASYSPPGVSQMPMSQGAQPSPEIDHINNVIGQYLQSKQGQQSSPGLTEQILAQRFQPTDADTANSANQTAQSFLTPNLFQPITPQQMASQRALYELQPYSEGLALNTKAAQLQGMQQQNQIQAQTGLPMAMAQLQKEQTTSDIMQKTGLPRAQAEMALLNEQRQKLGIENQYLPQMQQADILAKRATAGFLGGGMGGLGDGNAPDAGSMAPALHGDEFLKNLPPVIGQQVKALAEGRMQFPGGFALKSPYWQQMVAAVSQYDPNFDAVNYNARSKTRGDFTSGKSSQTINALNTGIGHLSQLQGAIAGLDNGQYPMLNQAENWLTTQTGGTGPSNFDAIKNSVAPELVRIWRGSGGAEGDIQGRLSDLSDAKSPQQLNGVIRELAELMKSKVDALQDQYQRGMGTAATDLSFYTPKSQQLFKQLGIDMGQSQQNPIATSQPNSTGANPQDIVNELRRRGVVQ